LVKCPPCSFATPTATSSSWTHTARLSKTTWMTIPHIPSQYRKSFSKRPSILVHDHREIAAKAAPTFSNSNRDALIYSTTFSRGLGSLAGHSLLLDASASGRVESGKVTNSLIKLHARYYRTQSEKRLFFATLSATVGDALDLDNPVQLGGDTGIRGYPQRYQNGESKVVLTIEQRFFTDWYPFRLTRVGMAVFADAGRVWGRNPLGGEPLGWLTDVGFGLRLAPTRSSARKMIHIDIAFPLNGDDSIDSVQILLESKRSF